MGSWPARLYFLGEQLGQSIAFPAVLKTWTTLYSRIIQEYGDAL